MTYRFFLLLVLSFSCQAVFAQKKNLLTTRPMVFSTQATDDVQRRMDILNKNSQIHVVLRATMFPLPSKLELKIDPSMLAGKTKAQRDALTADVANTMEDYPDFGNGYKASDAA